MSLTATTTDPDGIYLLSDSILIIEDGEYISNTTYDRLVIVCVEYPHLEVFNQIARSERAESRAALSAGYGHGNSYRF